jgi:hypothetical protein
VIGRRRPLVAPHVLDESIGRDGLVRVEDEDGEQRALPGAAERDGAPVDVHGQRPENPDLEQDDPSSHDALSGF